MHVGTGNRRPDCAAEKDGSRLSEEGSNSREYDGGWLVAAGPPHIVTSHPGPFPRNRPGGFFVYPRMPSALPLSYRRTAA